MINASNGPRVAMRSMTEALCFCRSMVVTSTSQNRFCLKDKPILRYIRAPSKTNPTLMNC